MEMSAIGLVAALAQREVVAAEAIVVEVASSNSLRALVARKPAVKSVFHCHLRRLLDHRLLKFAGNLVFEARRTLLLGTSRRRDQFCSQFVVLHLENLLSSVHRLFVVLVAKRALHCTVVNVRNKLGLQFLLNSLRNGGVVGALLPGNRLTSADFLQDFLAF